MDQYSNITSDAFAGERITPACAIPKQLLLFDNINAPSPLLPMTSPDGNMFRHMTFFFVMQGDMQFRINSKQTVVKGGQVLVTLPDAEVQYLSASADNKYLLFVIYPELLLQIYKYINQSYDKTSFSKGFLTGPCSEEQMALYQIFYNELRKECFREEYDFKMIAVKNYLSALLINSIAIDKKSPSTSDPALHSRQYDVYQRFMDLLNQYAKNERTVQFYADQLHISAKYLSFVTMQYSNRNASQWISEYVAYNAKNLLGTQNMTSAEAASQLNFPTKNSFNRFFKRVTGISPKEYIKQHNM
ncbi:MAG: AraC family transcriptional regulator [Bacteroidaceae bacterium]|nr:AraC family transcriptional regulator [Bacteroidaceae bacterium]